MKNFLTICIFFLIFQQVFPQDSISVSKYNPSTFSVDINGSIYLISSTSLYKIEQNSTAVLEFSNKMYGDISSIDVTNPFKILLFYKESGLIVFLDNHLKELQSSISLPKQGLLNVELVCNGSDNSFWVYYNETHQIIKFDYQLNTITSTADLSILYSTSQSPRSINERGNKLFFEIPNFGILVFYNSGNYIQTLHFNKISSFLPISENQLFFNDVLKGPTLFNFTNNEYQTFFQQNHYNTDNQLLYFNNKIYELSKFTIIIHPISNLDVK